MWTSRLVARSSGHGWPKPDRASSSTRPPRERRTLVTECPQPLLALERLFPLRPRPEQRVAEFPRPHCGLPCPLSLAPRASFQSWQTSTSALWGDRPSTHTRPGSVFPSAAAGPLARGALAIQIPCKTNYWIPGRQRTIVHEHFAHRSAPTAQSVGCATAIRAATGARDKVEA